jgi:hypothetical protein
MMIPYGRALLQNMGLNESGKGEEDLRWSRRGENVDFDLIFLFFWFSGSTTSRCL